MAKQGNGSKFGKWALIGGAIAGGVALIPTLKRRAMRVTSILKKDHRVVSGLIVTLQMTPRINGMVRKTLFDRIHNSLMVHMQAEEDILYPAMRHILLADGQSKVDESYRQHDQIKSLLSDLGKMDPVSDAFDRTLAELKNEIQHHVQEEEEEMFPILMERISTERQEDLGRSIHERKMDLKTRMAA